MICPWQAAVPSGSHPLPPLALDPSSSSRCLAVNEKDLQVKSLDQWHMVVDCNTDSFLLATELLESTYDGKITSVSHRMSPVVVSPEPLGWRPSRVRWRPWRVRRSHRRSQDLPPSPSGHLQSCGGGRILARQQVVLRCLWASEQSCKPTSVSKRKGGGGRRY